MNPPDAPEDLSKLAVESDLIYTHFAETYDRMVKGTPNWRAWISSVLPHLEGQHVLEISFGSGYLLTRFAGRFESYGVDYNAAMVSIARENLADRGLGAHLQRAEVEHLPYRAESFDTVVNTMAFSGYQDGERALQEMYRVLKQGGRLLLVDVNDPLDGNQIGKALARLWETQANPDLDMGGLFEQVGFAYEDRAVGGFGCVHLYLGRKY